MLGWTAMLLDVVPKLRVPTFARALDFKHGLTIDGEAIEACANALYGHDLWLEQHIELALDKRARSRLQRQPATHRACHMSLSSLGFQQPQFMWRMWKPWRAIHEGGEVRRVAHAQAIALPFGATPPFMLPYPRPHAPSPWPCFFFTSKRRARSKSSTGNPSRLSTLKKRLNRASSVSVSTISCSSSATWSSLTLGARSRCSASCFSAYSCCRSLTYLLSSN